MTTDYKNLDELSGAVRSEDCHAGKSAFICTHHWKHYHVAVGDGHICAMWEIEDYEKHEADDDPFPPWDYD
jgi:hypothetical protein